MKNFHVIIVSITVLCGTTAAFAEDPKAQKSLAEQVLEKYQSFETYHALWRPAVNDPNISSDGGIWEIAFDRKSKSVLFLLRGTQKNMNKLSVLLVVDGINMYGAMDYGNGIQKRSKPIDPNQLTYRDVRKAIPFLYPFDLPLIFSDHPFMEVIQGAVKETPTLTKDSDFYPGFEISPQLEGETSAQYQVDPNTLLLKAFRFTRRGRSPSPVFQCDHVRINKNLSTDLFNFEKQLELYTQQLEKKK